MMPTRYEIAHAEQALMRAERWLNFHKVQQRRAAAPLKEAWQADIDSRQRRVDDCKLHLIRLQSELNEC